MGRPKPALVLNDDDERAVLRAKIVPAAADLRVRPRTAGK